MLESQNTLNEYYVEEKKDISICDNKVANIIIAVPLRDDYDFANEKLYCYFPIREFKTPVNALIHAPFLTNNSRDDVPNDNEQINKKIFEESLRFLKEISEQIRNDNSIPKIIPIKTVTPTHSFTGKVWDKDSFNLKSFYLQLLTQAKLLPTVNNEYISIGDNPKHFDCDFPEVFRGNTFKELLTLLPENIFKFIDDLARFTKYYNLSYTAEELVEKINQISEDLDISLQVKIFIWWNNWCRCNRISFPKEMPLLLKTTTGKWIQQNAKIYLPTDTGVSILPPSLSWVNLCILNQSYVDELIEQLINSNEWNEAKSKLKADNIGNKRILDKISDSCFCAQFTEQSNSDLIIEEINKQIDTSEKAISFIQWFYEHYKDKIHENTTRFNIDYKLPDRDGNLKSTNTLFFGKEYGNVLTEKLFDQSKFSAIAEYNTLFNGIENDRENVLSFLKKCGVNTYPKADFKNLSDKFSFVNHLKKEYRYENNINYLYAMQIDGFEKTLEKLDTSEVVQWITDDIDLCNLILSKEKAGYFSQKSNSYKILIYNNEYILFVLNRTKWIQIGDEKYAPIDIVKNPKLGDKINGIYGISEHNLIKILNKQIVQEMKLGFIDSLALFPDKIIQQILLKLPEFDTGEISRPLYEDIIKSKQGIKPTYSTSGLKVLATDGKSYDNTAVRYADKRLPKAESESNHFIHIPINRSMETIKSWLGVERYKMNLELVSFVTMSENNDFEKEIIDIKISALTTLDETNNFIKKTRNLKIIPCNSISVKDIEKNDMQFDLDDYNYIKQSGKYYLKIPSNKELCQIRNSLDFRTSITEIFKDVVSPQIDPNKFAYLLINDRNGKKEIIKTEYGIDKWNAIYDLLFQSNRVNDIVIKFFKDSVLNEKIMHDIRTIDFSSNLSFEEYENLRKALEYIGKDIKDLNDLDELVEINIKSYLKTCFLSYKDSQEETYRQNCYLYAVENLESRKTFLADISTFRCYNIDVDQIENTIHQNYELLLKEKFPKFNPKRVNTDMNINIDECYTKNYNFLLTQLNDYDFTPDDLELHLNTNPHMKSLLYFEVPQKILEDLKNISNKTIAISEEEPSRETIGIPYNSEDVTIIDTRLEPVKSETKTTPLVKSEKSQKQYENESINRENAGKKAEQIAYVALKALYPNLIWHSKYSNVPADKNKGPVDIVCDMWTINADNKKLYFEIKSSTIEFEMSINEYNSMISAPNEYEVVLVDVATKEISRHKIDELEMLKQVSKYKFCFTQIKN